MAADLLDLIRAESAFDNLRAYFDETLPRPYSGRRFEALAGGGDRPNTRDMVTADDLVAVRMLSVTVPAEASIGLLEGELGEQISGLLAQIPTDVELGTAGAMCLVADGRAADGAWRLLDEQIGIDYVIAGKVMARKRPHLIPVYDQVVRCLYGKPEKVWLRLHRRLTADRGVLREELALLRARTGIPSAASLLRVLDVVLWMHHHQPHLRSGSCPGFGSVTLD
ncbi:DUF6308 family protein [Micromonospora sp. NBC_00821]|uniref:DUF6308 family protein n=1 Tax=Micromonospora sp. NBC_00821 TaxID=2975977 RepID=UPI002ED130EA|nr:DUF6308 family protein [Micromonospora sp. NBC_00821]